MNKHMHKYTTIVIRMPEGEDDKNKLHEGLTILQPFQTAMSLEDEMTLLELIQQHEDFDPSIEDDARSKMLELHAAAEAVV